MLLNLLHYLSYLCVKKWKALSPIRQNILFSTLATVCYRCAVPTRNKSMARDCSPYRNWKRPLKILNKAKEMRRHLLGIMCLEVIQVGQQLDTVIQVQKARHTEDLALCLLVMRLISTKLCERCP